jgi:hypothetical protein
VSTIPKGAFVPGGWYGQPCYTQSTFSTIPAGGTATLFNSVDNLDNRHEPFANSARNKRPIEGHYREEEEEEEEEERLYLHLETRERVGGGGESLIERS